MSTKKGEVGVISRLGGVLPPNILSAVDRLDVAQAQASMPADKVKILNTIAKPSGVKFPCSCAGEPDQLQALVTSQNVEQLPRADYYKVPLLQGLGSSQLCH